jgi:plastocyanin
MASPPVTEFNMPRRPVFASGARAAIAAIPALIVLAAVLSIARAGAPRAAGRGEAHAMSMSMTAAAMRQRVAEWYATHPSRGGSASAAPADSFLASGAVFDRDHSSLTPVDTAFITRGDAILFKWGSGIHTVTSGEGSLDPNSGLLFDHVLAAVTDNFTFVFDTVGTFPFFCYVHEGFGMRGAVVVREVASAPPAGAIVGRFGFIAPPWPNPTRDGVSCRFAINRAGHARLEVLDLQGRRVAVMLDRDLGAGEFGSTWDGRMADGARAPAGVYLVRLSVPGRSESRRLSLER